MTFEGIVNNILVGFLSFFVGIVVGFKLCLWTQKPLTHKERRATEFPPNYKSLNKR